MMTELQMDKPIYDRNIPPLLLAHRQRLFGKILIHAAPDRYWELSVINKLPGGQMEWDGMNISEQQERIAFVRLDNMIAALRAHHDIIEENKKAEARASQARNKGK